MQYKKNWLRLLVVILLTSLSSLLLSFSSHAEEAQEEMWNAKFQTTYVWQTKPSFDAAYSGINSLKPEHEKSYSFSTTAAFGWRPWRGGELYFDPEVVQGVALSGLAGLGGMTNGEQQKTSGPNPTLYRARLFLRQTWGFGGEKETVESDANRLAGMVDKRRLVLTAGNLAVIDIFGNSAYAHDPRTQFLNWALTTYGAYDFAADARGYSWGAAAEYYYDDWAIRVGRFMQPAQSNGLPLDTRLLTHYGDQIELEHSHELGGLPGKVRLLVFRNKANMGGFRDALADAPNNGGIPDVARVRRERVKNGFGASVEQSITPDVGIFARASWNDGASEAYAFTEIERSLVGGAVIKGHAWRRDRDTVGIAFVRNGLSQAHRDYLAAGGHGEFIGDGRLNYRPEDILETYYSLNVATNAWVTLDLQHITNPAYNTDRGPVTVGSVRLHAEF
jgi:high affinity Mn2+ porin